MPFHVAIISKISYLEAQSLVKCSQTLRYLFEYFPLTSHQT